jgi:hypothetical protein
MIRLLFSCEMLLATRSPIHESKHDSKVFTIAPQRGHPTSHRISLHSWKDVRAGIHGHTNLAMTQEFLHYLWMNSHTGENGGGVVLEVMKPHARQFGFLDQRVKQMQDIGWIEESLQWRRAPCHA